VQRPGWVGANEFEVDLYSSQRKATTVFIFIGKNGANQFSLAGAVKSDVDKSRSCDINLGDSGN